MSLDTLTPEIACEALTRSGLCFVPAEVRVEAREGRWLVRLPGQRLAWFAASEEGHRHLETERRVLRLLEARCTFSAPRVLLADAAGEFDVRAMVPGASDPMRVYAEVRGNVDLAVRVGTALGTILAQQHSRIVAKDVAGWLPRRPAWPAPREWIRERLSRLVGDRELLAQADAVMSSYEGVPISEGDRALVHTDVAFHNLGIDPTSHAVHGIFDYGDAAWADRHHDFRYLVLDLEHDELLDAAVSVYEPIVGRTIQRGRIFLYHAVCAIMFLADRIDTHPEERPCGRTLAEDLRWSKHAIARALSS